MSGQTKLIIITSDENIIQQFSFNSTTNTHIIDLDRTTSDHGDLLHRLADLTRLSESHVNPNPVSKRPIEPCNEKSGKTRRKPLNVTCVICGDRAIGFNYDVLSCASCKAFFKRNANIDQTTISCLTGEGHCSISHGIQQKCRRCRLERCFTVGMRKDFLQTKKKSLEENRNATSQRLIAQTESNDLIDETQQIEEILFGNLSIDDWKRIENLQGSFVSLFRIPNVKGIHHIDLSDCLAALITWSTFINQLAIRFINFIRQINEFEQLNFDDRLILIKYNLFPIFPLCKCYNYNHQYEYYSAEDDEKHHRFFSLFGVSNTIRIEFIQVVISLVEITSQDPTLLSLLLLILLFTPGLSMNEDAPPLHDSLSVYRAQCCYTKILWNYFVDQSGELESYRRFNQLISLILRIQSATKQFRMFFRDQCERFNAVDQITPLIQTVLNIC